MTRWQQCLPRSPGHSGAGPGRTLRAGDHRPGRGFQGPSPGVATSDLLAPRHVLAGARGGRWRHDGPCLSGRDHSYGCCRRAGADGVGDHPVHGQSLGRASEPGGQLRVRRAPRLPVAARARLDRRAADRCDTRRAVPARGHQRVGYVWIELSGCPLLGGRSVLDGVHPDRRLGQRDSRHRFGRAECRPVWRVRYIALVGLWGSPISAPR